MSLSKLFFTADQHFYHKAIIQYANRPFTSIEEMNETLIKNWNDVVPSDGVVYNLGDVALGSIEATVDCLNRLNGTIYLIRGNHEKTVMKSKVLRDRFEAIYEFTHELKIPDPDAKYVSSKGNQLVVLSHYAYQVWRNSCHGSFCLHGHSHNGLYTPDDMLRLDVGVDNPLCNFHPISYEQVKTHMKTKNFKSVNQKEE